MGWWVQVSLGLFWGKSSQNSHKPVLIFLCSIPCVLCFRVHFVVKVVRYYDLSVLFIAVMGFQNKFGWGVGGVSSIQFYFGYLEFR